MQTKHKLELHELERVQNPEIILYVTSLIIVPLTFLHKSEENKCKWTQGYEHDWVQRYMCKHVKRHIQDMHKWAQVQDSGRT